MLFFLQFVLIISTLLLTACDNIVTNTSVSVDSNAYYSAYQKSTDKEWRVITSNNKIFNPKTVTFLVDNPTAPYNVVFVCPSDRSDEAHKIFVYYLTASELDQLEFICRKSLDEIVTKVVHGEISGLTLANLTNPQGEMVKFGLSDLVSEDVLEAYAVQVRGGSRDFVAYKGLQRANTNIIDEPQTFFIRRSAVSGLASLPINFNVDFNRENNIRLNYIQDFDPDSLSTVQILEKADSDNIVSSVSFLSSNKTILELASSTTESLNFLPVPLDPFTEQIDGFFKPNEFWPEEGHELNVTLLDQSGNVASRYRKFFTESYSQLHNVRLPRAIESNPALSLSNVDSAQSINLAWQAYRDESSGVTKLYRWEFSGLSAPANPAEPAAVVVDRVNWVVNVSPGYLTALSRSENQFALKLPTGFDVPVFSVDKEGKTFKEYIWRDEWEFRSNTTIDWEMRAITTSAAGTTEDVVDYLLNRNFIENYSFTEAYLRSSITPTP